MWLTRPARLAARPQEASANQSNNSDAAASGSPTTKGKPTSKEKGMLAVQTKKLLFPYNKPP